MSRPLRLEFPGALYHVSARGNAGQAIFQRDVDREQFLDALSREVQQARWRCYGYSLLDSEYRLLVETPEANLGRGIGRLNAVYSQWFNRRYDRSGHLFQGRYKATIVDKDAYLLPLVRDLAWAPVRAGLVKRPGQWPWSSHRAIGKNRNAPGWLRVETVLAPFAAAGEGARKAYRAYVADGKEAPSPLTAVRAQMYLGGPDFLAEMAARVRGLPPDQVPKAMLHPDRPTGDEIVAAVAAAAGVARGIRIRPRCPSGRLSGGSLPASSRRQSLSARGGNARRRLAAADLADPAGDRGCRRPRPRRPLGAASRRAHRLSRYSPRPLSP